MSNNVNSDFYEVEIKCLNKVIAHMSCSAVKDTLNVRDLWVRKLFRNKGVEELLMEKLFDFAKDKKVKYNINIHKIIDLFREVLP